jgi:hypothetical protein
VRKNRYHAKFGLWHGQDFSNHDVHTIGVDSQAALRRAIRGVIRNNQPSADKKAVRDQLRGALATIGRHYQIMKTESTRCLLSEITAESQQGNAYSLVGCISSSGEFQAVKVSNEEVYDEEKTHQNTGTANHYFQWRYDGNVGWLQVSDENDQNSIATVKRYLATKQLPVQRVVDEETWFFQTG